MQIDKFLNNTSQIKQQASAAYLKVVKDGTVQDKKGFSRVLAVIGKMWYFVTFRSEKYKNSHIARLFAENCLGFEQSSKISKPILQYSKFTHFKLKADLEAVREISAIYYKAIPIDKKHLLDQCLPTLLYASAAALALPSCALTKQEVNDLCNACKTLYLHTSFFVYDYKKYSAAFSELINQQTIKEKKLSNDAFQFLHLAEQKQPSNPFSNNPFFAQPPQPSNPFSNNPFSPKPPVDFSSQPINPFPYHIPAYSPPVFNPLFNPYGVPQGPKVAPRVAPKPLDNGVPVQPPAPSKPKVPAPFNANWALDQKIKERFEKGENGKLLLSEAINNGQMMGASWLISRGVSLQGCANNITKAGTKIFDWLSICHSKKPLTPENLDHFALDVGYGYKTANLLVLDSELKDVKLESCNVRVPPFLPQSDFEMQEFLLKAHPEIAVKWKAFLKSFDPALKDQYTNKNVSDTEASKVPLKISAEGTALIAEIQLVVKNYFRTNTYHTLQMEEWLKAHPTEFLIVRSTGKEDTDTNSNAGGNDSIPFVKPNAVEISEAIGDVLSSYFGVKSVTQRLGAGDRTIFSEERPFIPVLLQVMVDENVGGVGTPDEEIPRSGVMFTSQNDKAEGVTIIQAALGNNEGVVSSTVAVDSYYVDAFKNIHSVIRKKQTRFVSVQENGKFKAAEIENKNPALEKQAALPSPVVKDLKRVADAVSKKYGTLGENKPMDMEYTVKLKDKKQVIPTIYVLQARPLQKMNAQANPPSYLDLEKCESPQVEKVMVQTLLDGQSYIRTVTKSEDVLFVDDMKAALKAYFNEKNPQNIKAIVVRKSAPSTSHESVVLRARGVLVFVADSTAQYDKAETLIKNSAVNEPVLLDAQRGLILKGADANVIKEGYISYPIPLEYTIPPTPMMLAGLKFAQEKDSKVKDKFLKEIKEALPQFHKKISDSIKSWSAGKPLHQIQSENHPNGKTIRGLLELMATKNKDEAKLAFASLVSYLEKHLAKQMKSANGVIAGANIPKFMVLETIMEMAGKEIIPALENNEPQTLERLFYLKFLDALIFQQASKDVVGGFSYGLSSLTTKKENALVNQLDVFGVSSQNLTADQLYMYSLKDKIWNRAIQDKWISCVQHLSANELMFCKTFFMQLNKLNMISTYLNLIFKTFVAEPNAKTLSQKVFKAIQAESISNPVMKSRLEKNMVRLNGLESQIEQWKKAKHVKKNFASIKAEFTQDFAQLIDDYKTATQFEKLALLEGASRAVDIYDRTIKSLKENPEFATDEEKVKYFAELLEGYQTMMTQILYLIPQADEQAMMTPKMGSSMSFTTYNSHLTTGHDYQFGFAQHFKHTGFKTILDQARMGQANANHLEARPQFNVGSIIIGSKGDLSFSVHWPDRLEEYFTTFHQNMEKAIQHLRMSEGLTKNILPDFVKKMVEVIESKFAVKIAQIGQDNNELKIAFNIPLRQHAGSLTLIINPNNPDKGMQLEGKMFGNDEHDRWDQTAAFVSYLVYSDPNLSLTNNIGPEIDYNKQSREGVAFSININKDFAKHEQLIEKLQYIFKSMTMGSIGDSSNLVAQWGADVDWENLPEEMSKHSLYANGHILSLYDKKAKPMKKALVAEQSLISMAKKGIKDYGRGKDLKIPGYTGAPEFSFIPGNHVGQTKSLVLISVLYLIKGLKESAEVETVVKRILANADLQKAFPAEMEALAKATKPVEEQIKDLLDTQKYAAALRFIEKRKEFSLLVENAVLNKLSTLSTVEDIQTFIGNLGEFVNKYQGMIYTNINLTPADKSAIEKFMLKADRKKLVQEASENTLKLLAATNQNQVGQSVSKEIIQLSVDALIGLAQQNDFFAKSTPTSFKGIDIYLGKAPYAYIQDNVHGNTTKLRKAAPLYIIKALESPVAESRSQAIAAMETLVNDWQYHKEVPCMFSSDYLNAIMAICKGYHQSTVNKQEACAKLKDLWKGQPDVFVKLGQQPYNIADL